MKYQKSNFSKLAKESLADLHVIAKLRSLELSFGLSSDHGQRTSRESFFFQKFKSFGLGQTNWAEILGCILVISSQTIGTILALWVPCSWESVAGSFSYKKCWFLGLKHTTPKYSQNKILAVKNLEKSLRTSVFGVYDHGFFQNT